jgi:hypothetical protein
MWRVARVTGLKSTRRYLCNRKTRIRYLFLEPERPDCFIGPIECNGKLIEEFRKGIIVKLKYVEKRVLDTFKENGVDLDNYTHCVIVKRNFYLAW